jgi:hypothetical protein
MAVSGHAPTAALPSTAAPTEPRGDDPATVRRADVFPKVAPTLPVVPRKRSRLPIVIGAIAAAGVGVTVVVLAGRGKSDGVVDARPEPVASATSDAREPGASSTIDAAAEEHREPAVTPIDTSSPPDAAAPTAPPDAPLRVQDPPRVRRKLTSDAVLTRINAQYLSSIQRCYADTLKRSALAKGRVALDLTVRPAGTVETGKARGFDSELDACITRLMPSWTFPASDLVENVTSLSVFIDLAPDPDHVAKAPAPIFEALPPLMPLVDRLCWCLDKACADAASAEVLRAGKDIVPEKLSPDDRRRYEAVSARYQQCRSNVETIEPGRISVFRGTVKDTSGNPLGGVTVAITDGRFNRSYSKATAADGSFSMTIPWGDYVVTIAGVSKGRVMVGKPPVDVPFVIEKP